MTDAYNVETGQFETIAPGQEAEAYASGRYRLPKEIPVLSPQGVFLTVAPEDIGQAYQQGYKPTTKQAARKAQLAEEYGGLKGMAIAGAGGVAGAASLGLLESAMSTGMHAEAYEAAKQQAPISHTAGQILGSMVGGGLLFGRIGNVAQQAVRARLGGEAAFTGARGVAKEAAANFAKHGLEQSLETGIKETMTAVADNRELKAEVILASTAASGLIGGVAGAGAGQVGRWLRRVGRKAEDITATTATSDAVDIDVGVGADVPARPGLVSRVTSKVAGKAADVVDRPGLASKVASIAGTLETIPGSTGEWARAAREIAETGGAKTVGDAITDGAGEVAQLMTGAMASGAKTIGTTIGGPAGLAINWLVDAATKKGNAYIPKLAKVAINRGVPVVRKRIAKAGASVAGAEGRNIDIELVDEEQRFNDTVDRVIRLGDPMVASETMARQLGNVAGLDRTVLPIVVNKAMGGARYLSEQAPVRPQPNSLTPHLESQLPLRRERKAFLDKAEATGNPVTVLNHFEKGTLTPDHVQALATTSPKLYRQIVQDVTDAVSRRTAPLPDAWRVSLDTLLGVRTMKGQVESMALVQGMYGGTGQPGGGQPGGGQSTSMLLSRARRMASPVDERELRQ